jgi:hypothetical protein
VTVRAAGIAIGKREAREIHRTAPANADPTDENKNVMLRPLRVVKLAHGRIVRRDAWHGIFLPSTWPPRLINDARQRRPANWPSRTDRRDRTSARSRFSEKCPSSLAIASLGRRLHRLHRLHRPHRPHRTRRTSCSS